MGFRWISLDFNGNWHKDYTVHDPSDFYIWRAQQSQQCFRSWCWIVINFRPRWLTKKVLECRFYPRLQTQEPSMWQSNVLSRIIPSRELWIMIIKKLKLLINLRFCPFSAHNFENSPALCARWLHNYIIWFSLFMGFTLPF